MPSSDFVLYIEDLSVSFDGFKAVDDISLYVEKGALHVVIGPQRGPGRLRCWI